MKRFLIIFEKTDSGFSAYAPDLPGCIATGKSRNYVEKQMFEAIQFHLDGLKESNYKIPEPKTDAEVFVFV
jgi:predicted RNase H-like HicB family nuclease